MTLSMDGGISASRPRVCSPHSPTLDLDGRRVLAPRRAVPHAQVLAPALDLHRLEITAEHGARAVPVAVRVGLGALEPRLPGDVPDELGRGLASGGRVRLAARDREQ